VSDDDVPDDVSSTAVSASTLPLSLQKHTTIHMQLHR
jgi:hypothetical protein